MSGDWTFRPTMRHVPELLRFLGGHLAFGAVTGLAFAALLLLCDVAGLRTLAMATDAPYVAVGLFLAFNALTFASLAMGAGVMLLPREGKCDMGEKPEPPGFHPPG